MPTRRLQRKPVAEGLIRVPPSAENAQEKRKRVLSGMRPTGRLHIGHYFGALQNWIRLQNDPQYECFYFIADWHALTTDYADTSFVAQNTIEIGTDWLAAGLDPDKSTLFVQSAVPEHAELNLLLTMITPLGWLERVPTYKEALENIKDKDLHTFGFLGYPVLQTADIVMYGEPDTDLVVPVGEDQKSHVELGREIVARFNFLYRRDPLKIDPSLWQDSETIRTLVTQMMPDEREQVRILRSMSSGDRSEFIHYLHKLVEDEAGWNDLCARVQDCARYLSYRPILRKLHVMLTHTPRIPGLDGRKISKSYGNAIMLSESADDIR